jgi:hypothetical protein
MEGCRKRWFCVSQPFPLMKMPRQAEACRGVLVRERLAAPLLGAGRHEAVTLPFGEPLGHRRLRHAVPFTELVLRAEPFAEGEARDQIGRRLFLREARTVRLGTARLAQRSRRAAVSRTVRRFGREPFAKFVQFGTRSSSSASSPVCCTRYRSASSRGCGRSTVGNCIKVEIERSISHIVAECRRAWSTGSFAFITPSRNSVVAAACMAASGGATGVEDERAIGGYLTFAPRANPSARRGAKSRDMQR